MTFCMQVDFHAVVEAQKVHSLCSQAGDEKELWVPGQESPWFKSQLEERMK